MELNLGREVSTNITNAVEFSTTNNSSKLFAMLSNMLYTNKERAVLTELSSNALDAHKMVGIENHPIHVTMPTSLCMEVRVRDFGPGLSDEDVIRFLTKYGESSKQQSNDFIGGFGIGSKSPAAVTDTWTVHSYHNGTHRQYLVFISPDGVPSLTRIVEKPTTEKGLEVVIPVKQGSTSAWTNACVDTFMHYPVKPVIHNFSIPSYSAIVNSYVGKNFNIYQSRSGNTNCAAIINHRQYPIEATKITEGTTLKATHKAVLSMANINLRFNIGELSLSLSRENLQYDKMTIAAIQRKLEAVFNELNDMWKTEVDSKAESELHYFTLGTEFFGKYIKVSTYGNETQKTLYNAFGAGCKHFSDTFQIGDRSITIESKVDFNARFINKGSDRVVSGRQTTRSNFGIYNRPSTWSSKQIFTLNLNITDLSTVKFVIDDAAMVYHRTRHAFSNENIVILDDASIVPEFLKKNISYASNLPKPKIERVKQEKLKTPFYRISGSRFEAVEEAYFANLVKNNVPIAYMYFDRINTVSSISDEAVKNNLQSLGISILCLKKDADIPTWAKTPDECFKDMYDKLMKTYPSIVKSAFMDSVKSNPTLRQFMNVTNKLRTSKQSKWNEFMDLLDAKDGVPILDGYACRTNLSKINQLEQILNKTVQKTSNKYDGIIDGLMAFYPLLTVFDKYAQLTQRTVYDNIIKYIESCGV